ncbi:MAG: putative transcriptional regulatory protein for hcr operon [Solirubrobacterales bacterium]|nr:putative transcriptional regulatory protein for hcr operon [Solirubrobacterales bacterium]
MARSPFLDSSWVDGRQHPSNHWRVAIIRRCYLFLMPATIVEETCSGAEQELTQPAGFLLAQLGRAMTRRYRCALSPIGLKPRETHALLRLRDGGAMSQQALGVALDIDASNLVALLNDLESESLISRRRDPADRRRHVVEVSKRGTKLLSEVEHAAAEVEDDFFDALDDDERVALQGLLSRVARSADVPSPAEMAGEDSAC